MFVVVVRSGIFYLCFRARFELVLDRYFFPASDSLYSPFVSLFAWFGPASICLVDFLCERVVREP